jgi:hypothetical protein
MRVHHLFDHDVFAAKFRKLVEGRFKRYGHFEYDTEGEIVRYKVSVVILAIRRYVTAYTHINCAGACRASSTICDRHSYLHPQGDR